MVSNEAARSIREQQRDITARTSTRTVKSQLEPAQEHEAQLSVSTRT